jgi:predicted kinase
MQQGQGGRQSPSTYQRGSSPSNHRGGHSPNYRGGGEGGRYNRGGHEKPRRLAEGFRKTAQESIFFCGPNDLYTFKETDPFNRQNIIDGLVSKLDGTLCITHVNNLQLPRPLIIWGMQSMGPVLKRQARLGERSLEELLDRILAPPPSSTTLPLSSSSPSSSSSSSSSPSPSSSSFKEDLFFLFSNKWNGANIQIFKYLDSNGTLYLSARHRGSPFVKDHSRYTRWDSYFTLTKEALVLQNAMTSPPASSSSSLSTPLTQTPSPTPYSKEDGEEAYKEGERQGEGGEPLGVSEGSEGSEDSKVSISLSSPSPSEPTSQVLSGWASALLATPPILQTSSKIDINSGFLSLLKNDAIQSITYELVGFKCPHLVRYEFSVDLKPLLVTTPHREMIPYQLLVEGGEMKEEEEKGGVKMVTSKEKLVELCSVSVEEDLETNRSWRKERGLPVEGRYWYNHFKTEGKVVYLLRKREGKGPKFQLLDSRSSFKVKPRDITKKHWEEFDNDSLICVLEGLDKLYSKGEKLSEQGLAREMDLNEFNWAKYSAEIMNFATGVPRKQAILPEPLLRSPSESESSPSSSQSSQQGGKQKGSVTSSTRVMLTVGYPGCGKSTFANKLIGNAPGWARVNQDEMGTRGAVERAFDIALKEGKNVLVDRTNFDIPQRHYWLSTAYRLGVTKFDCVEFRLSSDICKKRVSERENHPTIPKGETGLAIIDKFVGMTQWPLLTEGFDNIWTITSNQEADALIDLINPPLSSPEKTPDSAWLEPNH